MSDQRTDPTPQHPSKETPWWLDDPRNVNRLCYGLYAVCALLLVAGLFVDQHAHFPIEEWFGFQAWFGFIVFVLVVLAGKKLRLVVKRDEDYYDR